MHTSELQRNNKNEGIEWKEFRISVNSLCRGDEHKLIKVEFLEVRKGKANRKKLKINFVGEAEFSMREVALIASRSSVSSTNVCRSDNGCLKVRFHHKVNPTAHSAGTLSWTSCLAGARFR